MVDVISIWLVKNSVHWIERLLHDNEWLTCGRIVDFISLYTKAIVLSYMKQIWVLLDNIK